MHKLKVERTPGKRIKRIKKKAQTHVCISEMKSKYAYQCNVTTIFFFFFFLYFVIVLLSNKTSMVAITLKVFNWILKYVLLKLSKSFHWKICQGNLDARLMYVTCVKSVHVLFFFHLLLLCFAGMCDCVYVIKTSLSRPFKFYRYGLLNCY